MKYQKYLGVRLFFLNLILLCSACSPHMVKSETLAKGSFLIKDNTVQSDTVEIAQKDEYFKANEKYFNKSVAPNYYVGKGPSYLDLKYTMDNKVFEIFIVKQISNDVKLLSEYPQNNEADRLYLSRLVHFCVRINGEIVSPEISSPVFKNTFGDGFTLFNPWLDYVNVTDESFI